MQELEIKTGREHVDMSLLLGADTSMPRIMGQMSRSTCYCGLLEGKNVVICLLSEPSGGDVCEISAMAVSEAIADTGHSYELVSYIATIAREKGFNFLDVCAGNADGPAFLALQRMGFRLVGVERDYYTAGQQGFSVVNGIVNRDMLRYRVDFNAGWKTWTKEVKYK
jgi:ribosomal protein S18 acetylase RimI-like enzyme